jgi:secreted trypsin-like serine protease
LREELVARSESRIVDGVNVTPLNKYPMIVALQNPEGSVECAGTILDKYHVLTSGFCTTKMDIINSNVLAGINKVKDPDPRYLQKISVKNWTLHSRYKYVYRLY